MGNVPDLGSVTQVLSWSNFLLCMNWVRESPSVPGFPQINIGRKVGREGGRQPSPYFVVWVDLVDPTLLLGQLLRVWDKGRAFQRRGSWVALLTSPTKPSHVEACRVGRRHGSSMLLPDTESIQ